MPDPTPPLDFDGCYRACQRRGAHTLTSGCEHAPPPPDPTPVLPVVFTADDGHRSIRLEPITWERAAAMLAPNPGAEAHERALAGILCRSGTPHPQPPEGAYPPPCAMCVELSEWSRVALWDAAVAEGRRLERRDARLIEAENRALALGGTDA